MKEIKILIRNLKQYPDNFFVHPQEATDELKDGLVVCDMDGVEKDFIEIGGKGEVIIK